MKIEEIKLGKRFREKTRNVDTLCESIKKIGLLHPIVIDENNELIAGLGRLRAHQKLGYDEILVTKINLRKMIDEESGFKNTERAQIDENVTRRNFAPSEKVAIWQAMTSYELTGKKQPLNDSLRGYRIDRAAKILDTSRQTLTRAKAVVDYGNRKLIEEMDESDNVNKVFAEVRRLKRIEEGRELLLPEGKWSVFYADPPWTYGDKLTEDLPAAHHHYPTMTIEELCDLNIESITDKNAVLFLWVTSPILPECFPVVEAWGFEYKASFIWDKVQHNWGHYNSVRHEFLLVCIRGTYLPEGENSHDSVVSIKRTGRHSEKPGYFRDEIIEKMYPHGKWIELFARYDKEKAEELTKRGWTLWGSEIPED